MKMFEIESKENIGAFLSDLANAKYNKLSDFVKDYLEITNETIEPKLVRNTKNYFLQIFKGEKSIQTYHLVPFSSLLEVSCESILTAGKSDIRASEYYLSNYDIAASDDERTWKYQFEHNKREFLNYDEYGKTIFDYAIENHNYALIQFIKEKKLFGLNKNMCEPGWSYDVNDLNKKIEIKDEFEKYRYNSAAYYHISENDYYRSQLTAMAVERNDIEMLELIKARESRKIGIYGINKYNENEKKQTCFLSEIISIANTDNEKIIEYFTGEYHKKDPFGYKCENDDECYSMLIYNDIGEVAERMVKHGGKHEYFLKALRAIYEHNKCVRDEFQNRFDESYDKSVAAGYQSDEAYFVSLLQNVLELSEDKKIMTIQGSLYPLRIFTNVIRIETDMSKLENEHVKLYVQKINEIHDYLFNLRLKVKLKNKTYIVSGEQYRYCGTKAIGPFPVFSEQEE